MLNKIKLIGISSLVTDSRQADAVEPNRSLNRTGISLSLAALSPDLYRSLRATPA